MTNSIFVTYFLEKRPISYPMNCQMTNDHLHLKQLMLFFFSSRNHNSIFRTWSGKYFHTLNLWPLNDLILKAVTELLKSIIGTCIKLLVFSKF